MMIQNDDDAFLFELKPNGCSCSILSVMWNISHFYTFTFTSEAAPHELTSSCETFTLLLSINSSRWNLALHKVLQLAEFRSVGHYLLSGLMTCSRKSFQTGPEPWWFNLLYLDRIETVSVQSAHWHIIDLMNKEMLCGLFLRTKCIFYYHKCGDWCGDIYSETVLLTACI